MPMTITVYRNSINVGLPLFECPEAAEAIEAGDDLERNAVTGEIKDITKSRSSQARPLPPFAREIMAAGGLMPYVARKVGLPGAARAR